MISFPTSTSTLVSSNAKSWFRSFFDFVFVVIGLPRPIAFHDWFQQTPQQLSRIGRLPSKQASKQASSSHIVSVPFDAHRLNVKVASGPLSQTKQGEVVSPTTFEISRVCQKTTSTWLGILLEKEFQSRDFQWSHTRLSLVSIGIGVERNRIHDSLVVHQLVPFVVRKRE